MNGFKFILIAVMVTLLSACAIKQSEIELIDSAASAQEIQRWQTHLRETAKIKTWRIRGKLAVKAGDRGGHASLRWNRQGDSQQLEVFGPLGGGRVEIEQNQTGAILKDTSNRVLRGPQIEPLLQARLGWPLPFNHLASWIRGRPVSAAPAVKFNPDGELQSMNDSGWQVSFPSYQLVSIPGDPAIDVSLPRVIELKALPGTLKVYDDEGEFIGEELFVRLIIKAWQ